MTLQNIPPADALAQIRAEIKDLQQREAELRQLLLLDPSARTGNNFVASIRTVEQSRTDIRELRAAHPEIVAEFTFPTKVETVVLHAVSEDGEITSIPRRKAASA